MSMISPSKYLSLKFLREAERNYCKSPNGTEYIPEELRGLIAAKEDALIAGDKKDFDDWALMCFYEPEIEEIPLPSESDMPFISEEVSISTSVIALARKMFSEIKKELTYKLNLNITSLSQGHTNTKGNTPCQETHCTSSPNTAEKQKPPQSESFSWWLITPPDHPEGILARLRIAFQPSREKSKSSLQNGPTTTLH